MTESALEALTRRLDRLERESRGWRVFGSLAMAALGLILFTGAASDNRSDEVKAKRIVVVDKQGFQRMFLEVLPDGRAALTILGKDGKGGGGLSARENGEVHLGMIDRDNAVRVGLSLLSDGSPNLFFADKNNTPRLRAYLLPDSDGFPHLVLSDKNGKVIWKVP